MKHAKCLPALAALLLVLAGCSQGLPQPSHHLSGKVTFRGKPVPAGTITFLPDSSEGNKGQATLAKIKDGVFDTSKENGSGIYPGPNIVIIAGFDGKPLPDYSMGKQIFNPYQKRCDIAASKTTMDFDVPPTAAEGLVIAPTDGKTE